MSRKGMIRPPSIQASTLASNRYRTRVAHTAALRVYVHSRLVIRAYFSRGREVVIPCKSTSRSPNGLIGNQDQRISCHGKAGLLWLTTRPRLCGVRITSGVTPFFSSKISGPPVRPVPSTATRSSSISSPSGGMRRSGNAPHSSCSGWPLTSAGCITKLRTA
jgi:hypothetical protein